MAEDWSREEVEATVADYFDMLDQELRGQPYNKTAHRRLLSVRLRNRSDGAIERKHQNISAILLELGFIPIRGYKPASNYQGLLADVVSARYEASIALRKVLERQVQEPAVLPSVEDILKVLVAPPASEAGDRFASWEVRERGTVRRGVDYAALEAANRSLGVAGEEFVVRYEVARLVAAREDRLASLVERVSATQGDGLGYDVLSYDETGRERLIEVKTTAYGPFTPFFVTLNELQVSRETADRFFVYRPFDFRRTPKMFVKHGAIDTGFGLAPSLFAARPL